MNERSQFPWRQPEPRALPVPWPERQQRRHDRERRGYAETAFAGVLTAAAANLLTAGAYTSPVLYAPVAANRVLLAVSCSDPAARYTVQTARAGDWRDAVTLRPGQEAPLALAAGEGVRVRIAAGADAIATALELRTRYLAGG